MKQYIYENKRIYFDYNDFFDALIDTSSVRPDFIEFVSFQVFLEYVWVAKLNKIGKEGWKLVTVDNERLKRIYDMAIVKGNRLKIEVPRPCYITLFVKEIEPKAF